MYAFLEGRSFTFILCAFLHFEILLTETFYVYFVPVLRILKCNARCCIHENCHYLVYLMERRNLVPYLCYANPSFPLPLTFIFF